MKDLWHTFLKKDHANFTGFSQGEKRKPFFKKNWQKENRKWQCWIRGNILFFEKRNQTGDDNFWGHKKRGEGGQLYTHRESIHFRRCFHYKKRKKEN
uniref:Uncharacterized protein n=1 Tax=Panagrolaimus sp. PS1159 TaxID=55785 RepID=A0AC35GKD5_9BILA